MKGTKKRKTTLSSQKQKTPDIEATSSKDESKSKINWSKNDKEVLLEALEKYGSENIQAISKMLPRIPPREIKSKILEYSKIAANLENNQCLDKWLKLYQPGDSMIPEALLFISLFEEHPPPSELEGHDIRAIYNFLYRCCYEEPSLFDLSQKDRNFLLLLMVKVQQKIWPKCQGELLQYVSKISSAKKIRRVYPGKSEHSL
ncbi:uncharacterized protein LOC108626215 [Ceratina calcarata]|uniref:Uncharacterized protein LOC108626215 n=1 Tax=Ceratina calcarata TaxID=156304 RepID=A0AAJ7N822_9HYME|nr:uncharacterized protein LOC108626215 [Ceratina calcarata]